jgi:hypothetical protein
MHVSYNEWILAVLQSDFMKQNYKDLTFTSSSIYSWPISHILEHEFFCFCHLGSSGQLGKKEDLSFSDQLLSVCFLTFCGYHSRFNPECNTERGFINSLSIALGVEQVLMT